MLTDPGSDATQEARRCWKQVKSKDARTRHLLVGFAALLIAATDPVRAADDSHLRVEATVSQPDFYFEGVILTLALMFKGAGEEAKGLCVTDSYFGSPLGQRSVLYGFWEHRDVVPEQLGLHVFDVLCERKNAVPQTHSAKQWETAAKSHGAVPNWAKVDISTFLFAGMRTMLTFAAVRLKDPSPAKCIVERYDEAFEAKVMAEARIRPVLLALYDELRSVCPLFPKGPESKNMVRSIIPDIDGAARERILTASELKACDRHDGPARLECADRAFKSRLQALQ